MHRTNVSHSTGSPYTTLTSRVTDGENETPHHCASKPMNASKPSPSSVESVSDEQLPDDFQDALTDEVVTCRHLLRKTVKPEQDPEYVLLCIKETRARLRQLEQWADRASVGESVNESASN